MAQRGNKRAEKRTERSKIDATPPWDQRVRETPAETTGPFDERDEPADEVARADLGALRVPVVDGFDLRLNVNENQQVIAVTVAVADGHMELGVFAAPRNEGTWDDVRATLKGSLTEQKGSPAEREGDFGTELTGTLAAQGGRVPVRFVGIDGPRWLLRATFLGSLAEPAKARRAEQVLRGVIVVRGSEPIPVGDAVPLRLPKDVTLPGGDAADQ